MMKGAITCIALLLAAAPHIHGVTFSSNATSISRPPTINTRHEIDIGASSASSTQETLPVLLPISNVGEVCVLNYMLREKYMPVGRSYDGHNWEPSSGKHVRLEYACDETQCEVALPKDPTYYLTCFDHSLDNESTVARFLEKASFGPLKSLVDGWDYSNFGSSFAAFVDQELKTLPTYHRVYFRERLNSRSIESYKYGMAGPRACEKHSRWRRYAFTMKDYYLSSGPTIGATDSAQHRPNPRYEMSIETKTVDGVTAYLLKYNGEVRTVLYDKLYNMDGGAQLDMNAKYYLCKMTEVQGGTRTNEYQNDNLAIKKVTGGACIYVLGGNPTVHIDPKFVPLNTVQFLDFRSLSIGTDLIVLNSEKTKGGDLLLAEPFSHDKCSSLPDPYDNDSRSNFLNYIKAEYPMWSNPSRFNIDPPIFARLSGGQWAIQDYRLLLKENTIENPTSDGGGQMVMDTTYTKDNMKVFFSSAHHVPGTIRGHEPASFCVNARPTPFNEENCRLSYDENACPSGQRGDDTDYYVHMDETFMSNIQGINGINSNIPVAIDGLVYDADSLKYVSFPCTEEAKSRWLEVDLSECDGTDDVDQVTINTFKNLLLNSVDINSKMRDVYYFEQEGQGIKCHASDSTKYGFKVKLTEKGVDRCFKNVHGHLLSIYDITEFVNSQSTSIKNEFKAQAANGVVDFLSITGMTMEIWHTSQVKPVYVGRLGDYKSANGATDALVYNVLGNTMTSRTRTTQALEQIVNNKWGFVKVKHFTFTARHGGVVVCGSPGEVAADPFKDDFFDIINSRLDSYGWGSHVQKQNVWLGVSLAANDQLRQRMAWALSQIMNVSPTTFNNGNEGQLYLYDMYVRHALGNYKDLLREISFNPKMAEMLTFERNSAVRYNYDIWGTTLYPDENYAREFMQLYTIGLHKLHMNGLPKLDRYGAVMKTYDNKNILSFSRIWTGFNRGDRRGNYEDLDHTTHSYMDPMRVQLDQHDWFPKMNLEGGYLGDGVPLCYDLPERAFLRKGAKFVLLGGNPRPRYTDDPSAKIVSTKRIVLHPNSSLYNKICNPNGNGECQFVSTITLDENLACYGVECKVSTLVLLQVQPGVFYEYVQRPCVQFAFSQDAKKVIEIDNRAHMCAHPKMPVAMTACCGAGLADYQRAKTVCEYTGEHVTYALNEERCAAIGGSACDHGGRQNSDFCATGFYNQAWPTENTWYWTDQSCVQKLKVRIDGLAAIVHDPDITISQYGVPWNSNPPRSVQYVSKDKNMNFITVHWPRDQYTKDELFPTIDNNCWGGECVEMDDWTCLCDVTAEDEMVFSSMPTRAGVLKTLKVGAFEIDLYDAGDFRLVQISNGVEVFAPSGSGDYTTETVFKVTDKFGDVRFFKNMKSIIKMGTAGIYEMQNPSHHIDLAQSELRDVIHEIEAAIDHIFKYESTAPFVSTHLIKHFGVSNPSPRYVEAVATAFFKGRYEWTDGTTTYTYGDGKYGNLAAVAAAILLDREAMSVSLDADPSHGSLREPLLKVAAVMRGMEFTQTIQNINEHPLLWQMSSKTGQMVYESPDQFSFFRPDYAPPGAFAQASLSCPEAEILSMSQTVGMTNGFWSLFRNGLNDHAQGFGRNPFGGATHYKTLWVRWDRDQFVLSGDYVKSTGYLAYTPGGTTTEDKINELGKLLTAGRLSERNRGILVNAYNAALARYGSKPEATKNEWALRTAQQLITVTPEFHSTNVAKTTATARQPTPPQTPLNEPYKAIIVVFLFGGLDSFNVLTPDKSCGDLYESYKAQRGDVKLLETEMLTIDAKSSEQPCDKFAVHHLLSSITDIYNDGEGIFLANTGHLDKKVTKDNWSEETRTDLFSHTSLEKEAYAVDAFQNERGTGILGRLLDTFQRKGYAVGPNAINGETPMLGGDPSTGRTINVVPASGTPPKFERPRLDWLNDGMNEIKPFIFDLNSESAPENGMFADFWSQKLVDVWDETIALQTILDNNAAETNWNGSGGLGSVFKFMSQLIKGHAERSKDRDVFFIKLGGFDAHTNAKGNLVANLPNINLAFAHLREELKAQGNYDKVTIVMESEFGRTLTGNSGGGTDHAWGGNYFLFGGDVKGGRILGEYPKSFWDTDETNIGRGRILPTTSWDALWFGVSQWFGVDDVDMHYVLPNHGNFGCFLFTDKDIYKSGTNIISGCNGVTISFEVTAFISEPRYLTGIEQKMICDSAVAIAMEKTGQTARCLIVGQKIIVKYARRLLDGGVEDASMPLKDYLNSGGSRRLNGAVSGYAVQADTSLSYIPVVKATNNETETDTEIELEALSAAAMTETLTSGLEQEMITYIQNMTGIEEVAATTLAPTVSIMPSLNPTVSHAPTPKYHPSVTPSLSTIPTSSPSVMPTSTPSVMPTTKPTVSVISTGDVGGDPHFNTFHGDFFSFQGECDLVMSQSSSFASGLGLRLHIRTTYTETRTARFSYVSGVALNIGYDVLEVLADGSAVLNGELLPKELPAFHEETVKLSGLYSIIKTFKGKLHKVIVYEVVMHNEGKPDVFTEIRANLKANIMSVEMMGAMEEDSVGLMGNAKRQGLIARDGVTDLSHDWKAYGEEWQVRVTEPRLFQIQRSPQHPESCIYKLSDTKAKRRRLKGDVDTELINTEAAHQACSAINNRHQRLFCVEDVMATGDLDVANDPFYA